MTKKLLKIAIISDAVYPYNIGGKEKRIDEIAKRLGSTGHDVSIYSMRWPGMDPNLERINTHKNVSIKPISPHYPLYSGKRRSIKQAVFFSLFTFKLLKEQFDFIEADHMPHLVLFPLKLVSLLKRKKLLVTWNEVWGRKYWVKYMGILGNIAYLIEYLSVRLPDQIIAVSEHTGKMLDRTLNIRKQVTIIPNGIDTDIINKAIPSTINSDLLFAGRLLSHKNVDLLIKAVSILKKKHPNIRCLIVGNGPEKEYLKQLTINLKLSENVVFLDFMENHDELFALMKASRIFVLPSIREGFGMAVLEANACGIPVITTDHPDNAAKDLITDGKNGYLIKLDETDLAEKIKLCLKNTKKNDYLEYVTKYDWDEITDRVEEVYRT